jgi:histidine kinase
MERPNSLQSNDESACLPFCLDSEPVTLKPDSVSAERLNESGDQNPELRCARIDHDLVSTEVTENFSENRLNIAEGLQAKPTFSSFQCASASRKRQQFLSTSRAPILIPGRHAQVASLHSVVEDAKNFKRKERNSGTKVGGPDRSCSFLSTSPNFCGHSPVQFVLIQGKKGVGKTCLARTLRPLVEARDGYFVETRFDPRRAFMPFSALVSVILDWIRQVLARGPAAVADARSLFLSNIDQDDIEMIVKAMPCLSLIIFEPKELSDESFGSTLSSSERSGTRSENEWRRQLSSSYVVTERFPFVFGTIMRGISSPEKPVVVMYDDFQNADTDSVMLLKRTAIDVIRGGIVFVTLFQTPPLEESANPFTVNAVEVHEAFSQYTTSTLVSLDDLDFNDTKHFVSELLHPGASSGEMQHNLSDFVHQQTNGNISRIWNLLEWFEAAPGGSRLLQTIGEGIGLSHVLSESLLARAGDVCRFQVSGFLQDRDFLDGFADFLTISACLGLSIDIAVVSCVLPNEDIASLLQRAIQEGVFSLPEGTGLGVGDAIATWYRFLDDSLPGVIYNQLQHEKRVSAHVELGRRAWRQFSEREVDVHLFQILSQLMLGQEQISREKERLAVSSLCLHAGRVAAKMSSFHVALAYLSFGLSLLDSTDWSSQYDLILALTNSAAEMSLCTGQYDKMDEYLENALKHSRSFRDKVPAYATRISSFSMRDKQRDALDLGIEVLQSLGEYFPRKFPVLCLLREFSLTRRLLRGKSDQQLQRLPLISNEKKLLALQILHLIMLSAVLKEPRMAPFFACRMLRITLKHGLSTIGCFSFSLYGMMLISVFRNYEEAIRFSNLSVAFVDKGIDVEFIPRIYASHYGAVAEFTEPLCSCLQPLLKGHRIGLYTGDTEVAALCALRYISLASELDVPLQEVYNSWQCFRDQILLTRQESLLRTYSPAIQIIGHLIGLTDDPLGPAGDLIDYDDFLRQACIEKRPELASEVYFSRMYLAYIFNEYHLAGSFASLIRLFNTRPTFVHIAYSFRYGLVAAALAREKTDRNKNVRTAKKAIRLLDAFATVGPQNCLVRVSLLRAELASALGKREAAFREYITAITTSRASHSLSMRALSNECCARHLSRLGSLGKAEPYFLEALSAYKDWGATAKVEQLSHFVKSIYAR